MSSIRDPHPAVFQVGSTRRDDGNAAAVRVRDGRLELRDFGSAARKGLRVFVPAVLLFFLAGTEAPEDLMVLWFLVAAAGIYMHRSAVLSDVEDRIESTPAAELFRDATELPLADVSNVRRGGSLQTTSYEQVTFEHNGLEYSVLGSDQLIEALLSALQDGGVPGEPARDREEVDDRPDPADGDRTVGDSPASAKSPRPKGGSDGL